MQFSHAARISTGPLLHPYGKLTQVSIKLANKKHICSGDCRSDLPHVAKSTFVLGHGASSTGMCSREGDAGLSVPACMWLHHLQFYSTRRILRGWFLSWNIASLHNMVWFSTEQPWVLCTCIVPPNIMNFHTDTEKQLKRNHPIWSPKFKKKNPSLTFA